MFRLRWLQVSCILLLQAGLSNLRGSASDPGRRWFQRGHVFSGPMGHRVASWPGFFQRGFVCVRKNNLCSNNLKIPEACFFEMPLKIQIEINRDLKNLQASSEIIPEISRDIKPYALHMHFACHDRTNRRVPSGIWLQAQFAGRLVHKDYVCLCEGSSLGSVPSRCGWHAANDSESVESLRKQGFKDSLVFHCFSYLG